MRECTDDSDRVHYIPRQMSDRHDNAGYLYISEQNPWPEDSRAVAERVPDAWLEMKNGERRVRQHQRKNLPQKVYISSQAVKGEGRQAAWWLSAPFRFCLHCGVSYNARQSSDFGKLSTLGSEGRSTATTVMTLSSIRKLRADEALVAKARKL